MELTIQTRDGVCPSYVFHQGSGPAPGVLMFMDGLGIRPAMLEVAERLSTHGFFVLLPDLFYRSGPYEPMDKTMFADPEKRKTLHEKFMGPATLANVMSDTSAFLDTLAARPEVQPKVFGTAGYCMGGRFSFAAAGTFPDRVAVATTYHGGRLVTDTDDSVHLLAPKIRARVYVAGATEDPSFTDDAKTTLERALASAGVDHVIETYPARHGWVVRDMPAHDPAATDRHWQTIVAELGRLRGQ